MLSQRSNITVTDEPMWRSIGVPIANSIFVSTTGNDTTALPYRKDRAFSTITAAYAIAVSGDTIFVLPGTYITTPLTLKGGVNFHLYKGATIENTTPGQTLFTDISSSPGTIVVFTGEGTLKSTSSIIRSTLVDTHITIKNLTLHSTIGGAGNGLIFISNKTTGGLLLENVYMFNSISSTNLRGVRIGTAGSNNYIFNNVTIVFNTTGVANAIYGISDVKIYSLQTNYAPLGTITNIITGTSVIVDLDVS